MSFVVKRSSSSLVTALKTRSKQDFEKELQKNPVLWNLWNLPHQKPLNDADSTLNAPTTLPILYRSKSAVFQDISKENPEAKGLTLQLKQFTGYAKSIIHFYRIGIKNVWNNRKIVSDLKKQYHLESVNNQGKLITRQFKNGEDLVKILDSLSSLKQVEKDALKKLDHELILNITRRQFQTVLRTERDFFKIPVFALILVIFAEMTPVLCLLFPEITPSTCVFPTLLTKLNKHSISALESLNKLRVERYDEEYYSKGTYPSQNVWNIPHDELKLLINALNLKSRYLPIGVYPSSLLRQRLNQRFTQLKVDNQFLINAGRSEQKENKEGKGKELENFWSLSKNELLRTTIDRGLIDFTKDDLTKISVHELQIRLFFHLGLFGNDKTIGNIGLFGLNHLNSGNSIHFLNVDKEQAHQIHQWRINKHGGDKNVECDKNSKDDAQITETSSELKV